MYIETLEDLQSKMMDSLGNHFPENESIENEEILAKSATEISLAVSSLILYFQPTNKDRNPERVVSQLNLVLRWATAAAFILEVQLPSEGERTLYGENWPEELLHDGTLASLVLQNRMTGLVLDYMLEDDYDKAMLGEDLWAVISLVEVIATRVLCTFDHALRHRP